MAASLFEPEKVDWEWLAGFSPPEERGDRAKVLANYCRIIGAGDLWPVVLCTGKVGADEYRLKVQLLKKDGSPLCAPRPSVIRDYPPGKIFTYVVRRSGNTFKLVTPPVLT